MRTFALSMAAAVTLLAGAALAQSTPPAEAPGRGGSLREACKADIAQHCKDVEAGRGKRFACLTEKKAQLSPGCQAAIEARKDQPRREGRGPDAPRGPKGSDTAAAPGAGPGAGPPKDKGRGAGRLAACRTDAATFCQDVAKGGGERIACLQKNADKLDPACRAALSERTAHAKGARQACQEDRKALCGDVQGGGGQIAQCLKSNADKLSPGCKEAILR